MDQCPIGGGGGGGGGGSSSSVCAGSQRLSSTTTGQQVFKRAPLGSIFEWNSAPGSVDANGFAKNGSVLSHPAVGTTTATTTMDSGPTGGGQVAHRPQMPISAVRSPLPHRRLQQLNPLFLSAPTNPTIQPFPNQNVMITQAPLYAAGPMGVVPTYPSETPLMRMANPQSTNQMVPVGYNPVKTRAPSVLDCERRATVLSPPSGMDPRQILLSPAIPQQILNSTGYMMG
ncbi:unnamed protein product [Echinostoma caproni]|uniref:Protein muscleblind n=1 Tax=Echinostoma caproni TaxID=27848 RepID=A0A183AP27_9TREM|nr:unnamed protein product [Echinostoma caproni]